MINFNDPDERQGYYKKWYAKYIVSIFTHKKKFNSLLRNIYTFINKIKDKKNQYELK
jgi:hypothetical protein